LEEEERLRLAALSAEALDPDRLFTIKPRPDDTDSEEEEEGPDGEKRKKKRKKGLFAGRDSGEDDEAEEDSEDDDDLNQGPPFESSSGWMKLRTDLAAEFRQAIKEAWARIDAVPGRRRSSEIDITLEPAEDREMSFEEAEEELIAMLERSLVKRPGERPPSVPGTPSTGARPSSRSSRLAVPSNMSSRAGSRPISRGNTFAEDDDDVRSEVAFERMLSTGSLEGIGQTTSRLQRKRYGMRLEARAKAVLARSGKHRWSEHVESCRRSLASLDTLGLFGGRQRTVGELDRSGAAQMSVC